MAEDRIAFYSDFNCPFCYALNERIVAMGESARVEWRGIEHMPAASSTRSGLVDQTQLINEVSVVRKRAPEVSIVTPAFRPNTRMANYLVLALRDASRHLRSELRTRIYRAYWQDGRDISDSAVLRELVADCGLEWPEFSETDPELSAILQQWQQEWEGERFKTRLPALVSLRADKPLLGFPTYDLLANFISGGDLLIAPESLAACELKPRQGVLLVGSDPARCDTTELEAAYQITRLGTPEEAEQWLAVQTCQPDLILLDGWSDAERMNRFCARLRANPEHRHTAILIQLPPERRTGELDSFDAGATDVVFDLANPKVCQARLDMHLRGKRSATLLASLARMDYLTELPNRREADRRLEEEWLRMRRQGAEIAVIMIDIDHFKRYNDHYGHSMGDDCLRQVGRALARCLRRPADLLARYGGEEFIAILPDTSRAGAEVVAEALVRAVRQLRLPHADSPIGDCVTISAGIASLIPEGLTTPRELVELADKALYRAKKEGRDRYRS